MPADRFMDTNVLLNAYDLDAPAKRAIAMALVEEAWLQPHRTALSVQVMQEFHTNFVLNGHPVAEATLIVGDFTSWTVIENSLALFQRGLWLQDRWQISLGCHDLGSCRKQRCPRTSLGRPQPQPELRAGVCY